MELMHINQSRSLLVKDFPSFSECIIHMGVNLGLYVDTIYNDISRVSLRWFAQSIFPKKGIFNHAYILGQNSEYAL